MRKKNKNITLAGVRVENYAAEGKSLARVEGKVIFIENAVPGDVVDVRLSRNKKDWAEGTITAFRELSAERVEPFCAHFGVCGGCRWQMLPYPKQLEYKQQQVEDSLRRIGKITLPDIRPILGASETVRYRNKLEYTFSNRRFLLPPELHDAAVSAEQRVAGFHARGLFDKVVDIDVCHLQEEPTNRIRKAVRDFGLERDLSFYDIRNHDGWLRNLQIRICTTGEIMVNLVVGHEDESLTRELGDRLLQQFPELTTLLYTVNPKWNDSITGLTPRILHGKGYVIERLEDFRFKIGPKSFFQTNTRQACNLYRVTRDMAELTGKETVYDLYCGTGSIGIFVSRLAARVVGVEVIEEAIGDARENAALNGIGHARFFPGDVTDVCRDSFFEEEGRPDVIITDPPRAGMSEGLTDSILGIEAPIVVYVSCNPATQARDLAILDRKYAVTAVQPVDMFPHTHHIENIVQLKLREPAKK
ncbi:MAG TPA: 23S rRNA (uracil(1939)-C(5))-methyltransferase RlmD [Puia sp.]|nr:23S rRNA (uracil(1939)-C(5))-methyltransferase RlmD [Puia sp.]